MKSLKLKSPLKNLSIYGSKGLIVIYGFNDITGLYHVLEINRPVITTDGAMKWKQLPQELTLNQVIARKKYMQTSYKDMELLYENVHCIYGCIKLLDSQYLILVTKISKVASITGNTIYSIEDVAFLPVTFGMKNSADETRYRNLLGTFDFTKYLYFSYTYDLTKSYQLQAASYENSPPSMSSSKSNRSTCQHMFVWNSFAMKPFLRGGSDGQPLDHWCVPIIYGYVNQRNIQLESKVRLKFLLIARRSRLFAGTRYLRRGVDALGHVANEVETEQIFYLMSPQPGYIPRITSLVQCRGSIPLFWSHTNLYSPKPDVQLESDMDMRLAASKKHFENLFIRYGFNINVLNLVKQVDSRGEIMLGTAYKEACDLLNNTFTEMKNSYKNSLKQQGESNTLESEGGKIDLSPLTYIAYDFLTMAKYQHISESEGNRNGPNVFRDINKIFEGIYGNIGFYVDPPHDSMEYVHFPIVNLPSCQVSPTDLEEGQNQPQIMLETQRLKDDIGETSYEIYYDLLAGDHPIHVVHSDEFLASFNQQGILGLGSPAGLLQNGILRTNCMDCLDRTNVAQFCYAKLNILKQLKSIGLNLLSSGLQDVINLCMEVWAEHGDAIAIQYGGSGAMHKVDKQDPSANSLQQQAVMDPSVPSQVPDQEFRLTGGSKNALVAVQRYYSNISTDYDRQQSIDLLLGIYEPKKNSIPIWEEKLRTQHLRFGAKGRRQSDITAAGLHDLNLLLQLDKVTKKEKVRKELISLQQKSNECTTSEQGPLKTDGDFIILHDEDDEDGEEEDDEDVEEIWDDSPLDESNNQRKSIRIPLPGFRILDVHSNPFYHNGSISLEITEFRDIVEDSDVDTINLPEVVVFPFPPILINDSPWTAFRDKLDLSSTIPPLVPEQPLQTLTPQEKLYHDYLNFNYTFYPAINVAYQLPPPSQESKSMTIQGGDSVISRQDLRNEIIKEFYSSTRQNVPIQSVATASSTISFQESTLESLDRGQESTDISKISSLPPSSEPPSPQAPSKSRIGMWPFRRTNKNDIAPTPSINELKSTTPGPGISNQSNKRTDSSESQNPPLFLSAKQCETSLRKPSGLCDSYTKKYIDNLIDAKISERISSGDVDSC